MKRRKIFHIWLTTAAVAMVLAIVFLSWFTNAITDNPAPGQPGATEPGVTATQTPAAVPPVTVEPPHTREEQVARFYGDDKVKLYLRGGLVKPAQVTWGDDSISRDFGFWFRRACENGYNMEAILMGIVDVNSSHWAPLRAELIEALAGPGSCPGPHFNMVTNSPGTGPDRTIRLQLSSPPSTRADYHFVFVSTPAGGAWLLTEGLSNERCNSG
ncbi:hypothetical protein V1227_08435 [Lentzea sp. DG1S-22]|uniref:hypothetical protein n=1 Tax=Lentzea sp. DG1S-22 TaxID=3108822 RepID=UPI002E79DF29|nr:hypothetical protein [Lentzea sp. DG1S-22]WVH82766.1 hypothetical protein V1227_08435 [Lentzea sp. DG1S-22]